MDLDAEEDGNGDEDSDDVGEGSGAECPQEWTMFAYSESGGIDFWGTSSSTYIAGNRDGLGRIYKLNGSNLDLMHTFDEQINGIWGSSDDDIFVIGNDRYIFHYDGNYWTQSQENFGGHHNDYIHIWGTSSNNVYVAGSDDVLIHYNGSEWNEVDIDSTVFINGFMSVHGNSPDNVYVVGYNGHVFHFDGESWDRLITRFEDDYSARDIWVSPSGQVYIVGGNGYEAIIIRYNGIGWEKMQPRITGELWDIWGSDDDDIYVVGWRGISHYDGNSWGFMTTLESAPEYNDFDMYDIWISNSNNAVYAYSGDGIIYRFCEQE